MEIIDAHAHIYPKKISAKATKAIGDFYDIHMSITEGSAENLLELGKKAGVSKFIVHSCATKKEQVEPINRFIKEELDAHPEFIGFMTLHEDMTEEEVFDEINWALANGFKGIKLHPDFQKFNIDDEKVQKFYRIAEDKLAFLFHTGDDRYEFSKPYRLANMAKKYPKVNFIGAHFGGYRCWGDFDVYKGLDNVYFDTCSSLPFIDSDFAVQMINKAGSEKFFFGTDFPMWDASEELDRFNKLKISDNDKEKILGFNIKKLLKI